MPADPPLISPGPLVYFLIHSGTFIVITGVLFFILGLAFGWLTWSRHRRMARRLAGEIEGNKDEIALLKRKLAELASRQPADEWEDVETGTPAFPSFRGSEDLVLGSFLATASKFLPDSLPPEEPTPASEIVPDKESLPDVSQATPSSEAVPPIPEFDFGETAATNEVVSAPAKTSTPHILKSLIGATVPVETSPSAPLPADPAPVAGQKAAPPAEPPPSPISLPLTEPEPVAITSPEIVRLVSDPHLGLVYKTKPQVMDDLSQLKGVASGIQHRLNELGVYTFKQIALWSDENILEFSRLLSFKDRIHREQWVEQARELHYHAYNERV